jgi:hypothetical protein
VRLGTVLVAVGQRLQAAEVAARRVEPRHA